MEILFGIAVVVLLALIYSKTCDIEKAVRGGEARRERKLAQKRKHREGVRMQLRECMGTSREITFTSGVTCNATILDADDEWVLVRTERGSAPFCRPGTTSIVRISTIASIR